MNAAANLPAEWQLKQLAQSYLASVPHKVGETVQVGWFIFRVADGCVPPELESLDFQRMASFTADLSEAERIRLLQTQALERFSRSKQKDAHFCRPPSSRVAILRFGRMRLSSDRRQTAKTTQDGMSVS